MGRAELPLDPDSSPVARFAHDLRALRREAGSPTYRELARRTFYSVTSLSQAAAGRSLPTLTITLAFVEACGGDSAQWRRRWHELAATSPVEHPPPTTSAVVSVSLSAGRATSGLRLLNRHRAPVLGLVAAHRRAVSYVATVAADCPQVAGASAIAYDPAPPVWSTGTLGGWSGDGCYGEFFFESQSGRAAISPNYMQWTMRGIDATRAGCLISIFRRELRALSRIRPLRHIDFDPGNPPRHRAAHCRPGRAPRGLDWRRPLPGARRLAARRRQRPGPAAPGHHRRRHPRLLSGRLARRTGPAIGNLLARALLTKAQAG